ncbi:MAG: 2-dehydro-3-deoxygalactonokinase, partial [Planctomycetota bacterium]
RTSMAGEFLAALSRHTILKGSLPESLPAEPNLDVVREGARLARFKGFFNAAFQTRIAEVLKKRSRDECAALLVGATYGGDLWELVQLGLWDDACPVMIAGSAPLKNLYVELARELAGERGLEMLDAPVEISQHAAAIGALKVAFFGKQAATMDFA